MPFVLFSMSSLYSSRCLRRDRVSPELVVQHRVFACQYLVEDVSALSQTLSCVSVCTYR